MVMKGKLGIAMILVSLALLVAALAQLSYFSEITGSHQAAAHQAGSSLVDDEIADASYTPPPVARERDPKIQSVLSELQAVSDSRDEESLRAFAAQRGLEYEKGAVKLVVETPDDQAAADFLAAINGSEPAVGSEAQFRAATSGITVETSHGNLLQLLVPPDRIDDLATLPQISYVRLPLRPITFSVTSEGVADVGADVWHDGGLRGDGVKIAITDLGFAGYETQVAAGELPADAVVNSFSGDISGGGVTHGTGCAEIAYDVAPGAQFYLLNFSTDVELANMIDYIISEGIDVVSASWAVPVDFQGNGQGAVNDAVKVAHDAGVFWANAAGNSAQNHWGGLYQDGDLDGWHEFGTGDEGNTFTAQTGDLLAIYLTWDNWPATDQDYDLYLFKDGYELPVAGSSNIQSGTQTPYEVIYFVVPPGLGGSYHTAIANAGADGSADFQLFCHFGVLEHQVAARSISGQPADSAYVTTVGGVQVNTTSLMYYSSRGPTVDGRTKPDISAPTHVSTLLTGPWGFGGTSGATPHVAGAAAILKGAKPAYTPDQISSELQGWAADLGAAGKDNDTGSGKLDLPACGRPQLGITLTNAFWASYQEYVIRQLSVTWSLCNPSVPTAFGLQITESQNSSGVGLVTTTPLAIGDLPGGGSCSQVTMKYLVPAGVTSFASLTKATASDACELVYTYPQ